MGEKHQEENKDSLINPIIGNWIHVLLFFIVSILTISLILTIFFTSFYEVNDGYFFETFLKLLMQFSWIPALVITLFVYKSFKKALLFLLKSFGIITGLIIFSYFFTSSGGTQIFLVPMIGFSLIFSIPLGFLFSLVVRVIYNKYIKKI